MPLTGLDSYRSLVGGKFPQQKRREMCSLLSLFEDWSGNRNPVYLYGKRTQI